MGMPIVVDVRDEDVDDATLDRVFDWLRHVDATFSTYKDDSEISRINRGELALDDAQPGRARGARALRGAARETDGYFDARPRVRGGARSVRARQGLVGRPGRGDPRRRGAAQLRGQRRRRHVVARPRASRRLLARRHPAPARARPGREGRRVANDLASRPRAPTRAATTCSIRTRGAPPTGVLSVTITGPDARDRRRLRDRGVRDGRATGPTWTARLRGYEAMTILADETRALDARLPRPLKGPQKSRWAGGAFVHLQTNRSGLAPFAIALEASTYGAPCPAGSAM